LHDIIPGKITLLLQDENIMPRKREKIKCTCEYCGKSFELKPSAAKKRRFCSWKCRVAFGRETKTIARCQNCNKEIETYKKNKQKYCSIGCGVSARNKTDANPSKHRDLSGENNPMFGKGLLGKDNPMFGKTGSKNPSWKGGRKKRRDGYILAYCPDHPYAISDGNNRKTYVLEHRLIMERYLGRYLSPEEVVHHKDGNPSNNKIENLELFPSQSDHISKGHS
jgi:hypothetical protein